MKKINLISILFIFLFVSCPNPSVETFTITYTLDDSVYKTQQVVKNSIANEIENPNIPPGYYFLGWYDSEFNTFDRENTPITTNLILYGNLKKFTITFYDYNKDLLGAIPQSMSSDNTYKLWTDLNEDGYTFLGWYDENGIKYEEEDIYNLTGNIDLYAIGSEVMISLNKGTINDASYVNITANNKEILNLDLPNSFTLPAIKQTIKIDVYNSFDNKLFTYVCLDKDLTGETTDTITLFKSIPTDDNEYIINSSGGIIFYDVDLDNNSGNSDNLISNICDYQFLEVTPYNLRIVNEQISCDPSLEGYNNSTEQVFPFGLYKKSDTGNILFANGKTTTNNDQIRTKDEIGEGNSNTILLTNNMGSSAYIDTSSNIKTNNYAARIARDLNFNGKSDWYLPSIVELESIYNNLYNKIKVLYDLSTEAHISSTENNNDSNNFWCVNSPDSSNRVNAYKTIEYSVIAVRTSN